MGEILIFFLLKKTNKKKLIYSNFLFVKNLINKKNSNLNPIMYNYFYSNKIMYINFYVLNSLQYTLLPY